MTLHGLEAARKAAKKSQEQFASDLGMDQSQYSRLESGAQIMGESKAQWLARHLPGISASELMLANKSAAFKRAMTRGDKVGVLKAAESFVRHAEGLPADPQLDDMLDRLVAKAVGFAEGSEDAQTYSGGLASEGRDILGVRKSKSKTFLPTDEDAYPEGRVDEGYFPLYPGHQDSVFPVEEGVTDDRFGGDEEEEYGDVDDGRDPLTGIRIRPLDEE